MSIVFLVLLGICMINDLQCKKIPAVWIWMCILVTGGYQFYGIITGKSTIIECFMAILPGMGILMFSHISKQIGNGDGLLIVAVGLYLGWQNILVVLMFAFLFAALFSVGYLVIKRGWRDYRIPFVPFLCLALGSHYIGALL